jgi:hypothetical protein
MTCAVYFPQRLILLLSKFGGSVALRKRGAQLSGNRQETDLVLGGRLDADITQSFAARRPDPRDELCQSLFARITEIVIGHKTKIGPATTTRWARSSVGLSLKAA